MTASDVINFRICLGISQFSSAYIIFRIEIILFHAYFRNLEYIVVSSGILKHME